MTTVQQVALVTGTSSGIGKATALTLHAAGYTTYATARRIESLADLAAQGCHTLQLDVTDEASMFAAVQAVEAAHGAVDVLINNAGYGLNGPVEELAMDEVRREFETNVFGLVRMAQLVLPQMRLKGKGRIINIGSVGGTFTAPGSGSYHATKYAVEAFSDALRMEVQSFGVQVVLVQPTGVSTPFFQQIDAYPPDAPEKPYAHFKQQHANVVRQMVAQPRRYGLTSAEHVAQIILKAVQSPHPHARYKAGTSAYVYAGLRRLLSDRMWDRMMAMQFPVQPPQG